MKESCDFHCDSPKVIFFLLILRLLNIVSMLSKNRHSQSERRQRRDPHGRCRCGPRDTQCDHYRPNHVWAHSPFQIEWKREKDENATWSHMRMLSTSHSRDAGPSDPPRQIVSSCLHPFYFILGWTWIKYYKFLFKLIKYYLIRHELKYLKILKISIFSLNYNFCMKFCTYKITINANFEII